jgi:K+-transporting ATPase KdpF subunit
MVQFVDPSTAAAPSAVNAAQRAVRLDAAGHAGHEQLRPTFADKVRPAIRHGTASAAFSSRYASPREDNPSLRRYFRVWPKADIAFFTPLLFMPSLYAHLKIRIVSLCAPAYLHRSSTSGKSFHARSAHARHRLRPLRADDRLCRRLRPALKRCVMSIDYSLAALVTAGLLVYLTYALLRPERF